MPSGFISVINLYRGGNRFTSLLKMFDEEKRLFFDVKEIPSHVDLLTKFDIKKFGSILQKQKEKTLAWLEEALTFKKEKAVSTYDLLTNRLQQILLLLSRKSEVRRKCLRYKILKTICFGKMRKHYKEKYKEYRKYKKQINSYLKEIKL